MNKQQFLELFSTTKPSSFSMVCVDTVEVDGTHITLNNPVQFKGQVVLGNNCTYHLEGCVYDNKYFMGNCIIYNDPIFLISHS